jgi:glycine/serine hydroxymethyltransferase
MYNRNITIEQTDPELWASIQAENARQEHHIELKTTPLPPSCKPKARN